MSNYIDIDLNLLNELSKTHTRKELAEIFCCSISAIGTRLNKIKVKDPKVIEKPERKRFTPGIRDYLFESYL